eukprot:scaffold3403_cov158-Amphora_coffeaeformis.AAC.7
MYSSKTNLIPSSSNDESTVIKKTTSFRISSLPVVGWPYYQEHHARVPTNGTEVLVREITNEYDTMLLRFMYEIPYEPIKMAAKSKPT